LANGSTAAVDLVLSAIGLRADTTLAAAAGLAAWDPEFRTRVPAAFRRESARRGRGASAAGAITRSAGSSNKEVLVRQVLPP